MIKRFSEHSKYKSGNLYKFGCVMIYPQMNNWDELTSMIDTNDIYNEDGVKGIERIPHITLLYGLHKEVSNTQVSDILKNYQGQSIELSINGITKFDNEKFSVVKLDTESPILYKINSDLKTLPYTSDFDRYLPHMTIAFVKPGAADKYVDLDYKLKLNFNLDFVYTSHRGRFRFDQL